MATEAELTEAIRRAGRAGDGAAVRALSAERDRVRAGEPKQDTRPTSWWQGLGEGLATGAGNTLRVLEQAPILGDSLRAAGLAYGLLTGEKPTIKRNNLTGAVSPSIVAPIKRMVDTASAKSTHRGSTGGRIVGGMIASAPLAMGPGGALLQGAVSGAQLSDDIDDPRRVAIDSTAGAVTGKLGEQIGKRVIAPVAERVGRTAPAQAVKRGMFGMANRMLGTHATPATVPTFTPTDRILNRTSSALDDVRANLSDAADLGLPYSLADASPELRQLAGSVSRKAPSARALAENTFGPRALGQADRATSAIDDMLAPITDIAQRSGAIRESAQAASRPFYDQARAMAAPVDEELTAMIRTPAGQAALKKAFTIAANEGRDPQAMGMFRTDDGTIWMGETPTFETLQLVKRGLDAELSSFRNPISGKLDLEGNPAAQSINGLLGKFNQRLKDLNEPYRLGNEAYAREIARREALALGGDIAVNNVPKRTFDAAVGRMGESTLPEMQRGYATAMADAVNRQRFSTNPYKTVYGSPLQQEKVAALFPEGASRFNRLYNLEGDMGLTAGETLGGSPTQARAMADQLFDSKIANGADAAMGIVSNPQLGMLNLAGRAIGDQLRTGGEKKAAAIAPDLFQTDPKAALQLVDDLARRNADMEARLAAYGWGGGQLARPVGTAMGLAAFGTQGGQ